MTDVQHTLKVRRPFKDETGRDVSRIVDIACPPFASVSVLDTMLAQLKREHPDWTIVSKSWTSHA